MTDKCINLFKLIPTSQPHLWLIAADWLEEKNKELEANAFRESIFNLEIIKRLDRQIRYDFNEISLNSLHSHFHSNGRYAHGYACGSGRGVDGYACGSGDGRGNINARGYGHGHSDGSGDGYGGGYGGGDGHGGGTANNTGVA